MCEETIFRGILFAATSAAFPGINAWVLPIIAAAIFAVPHAYQGVSGITKAGLAGLLLGYLYAATGSLLFPIVAHATIDMTSMFLAPPDDGHQGTQST